MIVLTVSLSKTFSDTRVMKYINWYLDKSYKVHAIGLDENCDSSIKNNKNFEYEQLKKDQKKKLKSKNSFLKLILINFFISFLVISSLMIINNFISIKVTLFKFFSYFEHVIENLNIIVLILILALIITFLNHTFFLLIRMLKFNNPLIFFKRFWLFFNNFKRLILKKKNISFEIIHLHDLWTVIFIFILKRKYPKAKIILDLHELYEEVPSQTIQYRIRCKIFIIILKLFREKIDHFIAVNDYAKEYYEKKHGLRPFLIINNSCDIKKIDSLDYSNKTYQSLIKLKQKNKKILIYQGGLSYFRGVIEVCNFFKNQNPKNWILFIIGNGKLEGVINEIIDGNIHDNIFRFEAVNLNDLSHYTKKADLGIINYENNCLNHNYCNPNKLWEYSSCGIPMLLSNCTSFINLNYKYNFAKIIYDKSKLDTFLSEYLNELDNHDKLKLLSNNAKKFYDENNSTIEKDKFNNFLLDFVK